MTAQDEENQLLKNTIDDEQRQVADVVRRLGSKISGLMIVCGLLVAAFGFYSSITPQDPQLSLGLSIIFAGALAFLGGLNIFCGLLLLLGED